jgi:hypothetical protein
MPKNLPAADYRLLRIVVALVGILLVSTVSFAQLQRGWGRGRRQVDRSEYPMWKTDQDFTHDVFTFARIQYDSWGGRGWGRGGNRWGNDYPDSDWNFSFRLQELTSLEVDPDGKVLQLTNPEVFDHPFLYMNGVGGLHLSDPEAMALRRYLQNGGFLMVDDFWGDRELDNVLEQFERVLPGQQPRELPMSHGIFHIVYELEEKPQVPSIRHWREGRGFEYHGPGSETGPHFLGILDEGGRLVTLLCHNNDIGDGWEREGEDSEYFLQCSEKLSFPMGINIVTYAMTH